VLSWTAGSLRHLAGDLTREGHLVSVPSVASCCRTVISAPRSRPQSPVGSGRVEEREAQLDFGALNSAADRGGLVGRQVSDLGVRSPVCAATGLAVLPRRSSAVQPGAREEPVSKVICPAGHATSPTHWWSSRARRNVTICEMLRDVLDAQIARKPRKLIIDLAALRFMDSAALYVLLTASRSLAGQGGTLALASPTRVVAAVLRLSQAARIVPVYENAQEAVAA
jgi:anti-anti-sigma factor